MADDQQEDTAVAERLDRIADLIAVSLVRDLEREEQFRLLSAVGYSPTRIGELLGIRGNTVSVALTRMRQRATRPKKKATAKPSKK
jgi:DNA-binding CsgD family transcriptional regulator